MELLFYTTYRKASGSLQMKSSIMTMSFLRSSFGPGATLPAVIRTRAMRALSNTMPKKKKPPSPGEEYQPAVSIEVIDQRAGPASSIFRARTASIRQVNACEDHSEPLAVADTTMGPRYKEQRSRSITPYRSEQP
jgi:hypothetical protein